MNMQGKIEWPEECMATECGEEEVHLWAFEIDIQQAKQDSLQELLTEDEQARAARFRFDQVRTRFTAARAGLRKILASYLASEPAEIVFVYDALGKPSLNRTVHTSELTFNLSHTGGLAVIGVGTGCAIGVDLECLRPVRHAEGIAKRYFHPQEAADVLGQAASLETQFFRCWTRKEAVVKAIGAGLQYPLDSFRVPVLDDEPSWVDLPGQNEQPARRSWLQSFSPCRGYIGAMVCINAKRQPVYRSLVL